MRINNNFEIEIEKISFGGSGLGRIDGKVCFVLGVLPGEVVEVEIKKEKSDYYTSKLLKVIKPSPKRIEEECPLGKFCPGCNYQHIDYSMKTKSKTSR